VARRRDNVAGNSTRRGAVAKSKKGPTAGTGGNNKRRLAGRGPTPKAEERTYHPAAKRKARPTAAASERAAKPSVRAQRAPAGSGGRMKRDGNELVAGRNSVLEALRAKVPARELLMAARIDVDDRIRESLNLAIEAKIPVREVPRGDLDRQSEGAVHQGIILTIPPYEYADLEDLFALAKDEGAEPLIVALDGVTDPRNLGAIIRSAAAFGAHGVVVPERRAANMTASAWKTAAGAASRLPVARVTNLVRAIEKAKEMGCTVIGLDADGDLNLTDFKDGADPLMLVIGSEGKGLSRLIGETCDLIVSIQMHSATESLNASVAASIVLHAVANARQ
jgi:23S rRNA (guanosine2251-2'-O)-methyltransferase